MARVRLTNTRRLRMGRRFSGRMLTAHPDAVALFVLSGSVVSIWPSRQKLIGVMLFVRSATKTLFYAEITHISSRLTFARTKIIYRHRLYTSRGPSVKRQKRFANGRVRCTRTENEMPRFFYSERDVNYTYE